NPKNMNTTSFVRSLARVGCFACSLLSLDPSVSAQETSTGIIEGRVLNPGSGEFIENARITVEGTSLETFTDSSGQYRITNVPAGVARVKAFRTGAAPQTQSITVTAGQTQQQNFDLAGFETKTESGRPVRLDRFVVNTSKEM